MTLTREVEAKAVAALEARRARPQLAAALLEAVPRAVDAFFARYPALNRTRVAEAVITSLVIERLSSPADSQSAQPQKAA